MELRLPGFFFLSLYQKQMAFMECTERFWERATRTGAFYHTHAFGHAFESVHGTGFPTLAHVRKQHSALGGVHQLGCMMKRK